MIRREPRVGCGAVILDGGGAIYLLRRVKEPEAGHWGLCGGKIDWGETTEAAVRREVAEELGIAIRETELLCLVDMIDAGDGEHWVSPVYLATAWSGEPFNREPEKHSGAGWFARDALPSPLTTAARTALEALAARGL